MANYTVGNGMQQIKMALDVDTIAMAASRAFVDNGPDNDLNPVAQSDNATGDIALKKIGAAFELQNHLLIIISRIGFFGSLKERKKQFEDLTAKCLLSEGDDGFKKFDEPEKRKVGNFDRAELIYRIDFI